LIINHFQKRFIFVIVSEKPHWACTGSSPMKKNNYILKQSSCCGSICFHIYELATLNGGMEEGSSVSDENI
jgi:hypothetical protein